MDEELAQRLFEEEQAQFEREQRIAIERACRNKRPRCCIRFEQMDVVHARMECCELLDVVTFMDQERDNFSIDEQHRVMVENHCSREMEVLKNYKIFSEMIDDFDRQDVMDLHRLGFICSCGVHVLLMGYWNCYSHDGRKEISSYSRNAFKDVK
ncbi:hypothetical protein Tco_0824956 [Tanacetum coccineum]